MKTIIQNANRIQLVLKDSSVITLDKLPPTLVQRTKEYLEKLKQGKTGSYTPPPLMDVKSFGWFTS